MVAMISPSILIELWKLGTGCKYLVYLACACMFSLVSRLFQHRACCLQYYEGFYGIQMASACVGKAGYEVSSSCVSKAW